MMSVCLSVCLSITFVDHDHIVWKSCKLIARTLSPTPSLFVAKGHPPTPRGTCGNVGETSRGDGLGKVACWSTKAAISLIRVKIEETLLWCAYRNSPALFRTRTIPEGPIPYGLLFPKIGVRNPHPKLQSLFSQE